MTEVCGKILITAYAIEDVVANTEGDGGTQTTFTTGTLSAAVGNSNELSAQMGGATAANSG